MSATETATQQQIDKPEIRSLRELALRAILPGEGKRIGFFREMRAEVLPVPMSGLWQERLARLLHCVGFGLRQEAQAIFKDYPAILLWRGTLIDFAAKTYKNITAFEYAVHVKDTFFIEMVVAFLESYSGVDKKVLAQELTEQYENSSGTGRLESVDRFIKAVEEWHTKFPMLSGSDSDTDSDTESHEHDYVMESYQHCVNHVGSAQALFEAHILQRYCNLESFSESPTFTERYLPEKLEFFSWHSSQNEPLLPASAPGANRGFLLIRAGYQEEACSDKVAQDVEDIEVGANEAIETLHQDLLADCKALDALDRARTCQLSTLMVRLESMQRQADSSQTEATERYFTPTIRLQTR